MSPLLSGLLFQAASIIVSKVANASKDDWQKVQDWVLAAENRKEAGALKGQWVKDRVKDFLPHIVPFARDLLISLAVGLLNKQGKIHVKI